MKKRMFYVRQKNYITVDEWEWRIVAKELREIKNYIIVEDESRKIVSFVGIFNSEI